MAKLQEGTRVLPGASESPGECRAIAEVLARVGDRWTVLVVRELGAGAMRFGALRRALGDISQRMLTLTLRNLERDGLVTRTAFDGKLPHVEYALSPLGADLLEVVADLADWARRNRPAIEAARGRFDERGSGRELADPGVSESGD